MHLDIVFTRKPGNIFSEEKKKKKGLQYIAYEHHPVRPVHENLQFKSLERKDKNRLAHKSPVQALTSHKYRHARSVEGPVCNSSYIWAYMPLR